MRYDSWTCLMVENGPGTVSDGIRTALKMAACTLFRNQKDALRFESGECEGKVETTWKPYILGAISGALFRSELVSNDGLFKVNFLMSEADLERGAAKLSSYIEEEDGAWAGTTHRFPVEDLYEFDNLSSGSILN